MPDGVLDYSSHENLSAGFRIEIDGPVTRVYRAPPSIWPRMFSAIASFAPGAMYAWFLVRLFQLFPHSMLLVRPVLWLIAELVVGSCIWVLMGTLELLWIRKWSRTPTVLEASPQGMTIVRPGVWRLRTRVIPRSLIKRIELKHARSAIRGLPDRMDLFVILSRGWPRRWYLRTRNIADAQHARDALAKALGLP
jgi:hypothetical protein